MALGRLDKAEDLSVSLPGVSMKREESWTGRLAGVDPAGLISFLSVNLLIQCSHQNGLSDCMKLLISTSLITVVQLK